MILDQGCGTTQLNISIPVPDRNGWSQRLSLPSRQWNYSFQCDSVLAGLTVPLLSWILGAQITIMRLAL